jgi:hypothetical protein
MENRESYDARPSSQSQPMSQSSLKMSRILQPHMVPGAASQTSHEEEEALREAYLNIIQADDWRRQFEDVATDIAASAVGVAAAMGAGEQEAFTVAFENRLFEFDAARYNTVLIGRMSDCDVPLPKAAVDTSRVHAVVFLFPASRQVMVVDVGSASGIRTTKRSSGASVLSSKPRERSILVFEWGEVAVLLLGSLQVCLNPKLCVICLEHPRALTFAACSHFVCCGACAAKVAFCPLCRTNLGVNSPVRGFGVMSHARVAQ